MKKSIMILGAVLPAVLVPFLMGRTRVEQDRVRAAFSNVRSQVEDMCQQAGLPYPPNRLYIRAFKREKQLEVWGSDSGSKPFRLLHTYSIAAMSGTLGPKRREGDLQVPEGFYHIDRFNPKSRFHLSLGINYPNASDLKFCDPDKPGGDIFIHGNAVSIGCMAMTDPKIEEIYIMAIQARDAGQSRIPVHIFPFRMRQRPMGPLADFWGELKPVYDYFEKHRTVPVVRVDSKGKYSIAKG